MSAVEQLCTVRFADDAPLPPLRSDIDILPFAEQGEYLVVLYDRRGYAPEPMVLHASVLPVLRLADAVRSARDIAALVHTDNNDVSPEYIASLFASLERAGFLNSPVFHAQRQARDHEFLLSPVRKAACAGTSYPDNAAELQRFLEGVMQTSGAVESNAAAVVVPHIDLRVGAECYAPAYGALRNTDADLFVVIGTSHYGWRDLFILTEKDFCTPLGTVKTDVALVRALRDSLPFELQPDEIAHRDEHSIEFQLLFLQHLLGDQPFTVLPVLVTSFQPFIDSNVLPAETERFRAFIAALRSVVAAAGRKVVFIASADMAHIGRKFGDDIPAAELLPELVHEDAALLRALTDIDTVRYFREIAAVGDRRRICGLPPVYSMLEAVQPVRGVTLDYRQWDERDTESAVTFASMAFYA